MRRLVRPQSPNLQRMFFAVFGMPARKRESISQHSAVSTLTELLLLRRSLRSKGTVENNEASGIIDGNYGKVENNLNGATINGNYGTVSYNKSGGTIKFSTFVITTNEGNIEENNGQVVNNNLGGQIDINNNIVANNSGIITENYGSVWNNTGTIKNNYTSIDGYGGIVSENIYRSIELLEMVQMSHRVTHIARDLK